MDRKRGLSQRLLLGDWMPLTHGWSLLKILWIPYTRHVTNASVRETTGCPPVSSIIKTRRLRFFGHVARSESRQDHHPAVNASLRPPGDWRRPRGRPLVTWLRTINADVQSANTGINSAWRKANDRALWRRIIDTATLRLKIIAVFLLEHNLMSLQLALLMKQKRKEGRTFNFL